MRKKFNIKIGDAVTEYDVITLVAGFISLILGLVVMVIVASTTDAGGDEHFRQILMLISGIMMIVGMVAMVYAFYHNARNLYVKNGCCSIVDKKTYCSGGCNRCAVALVYLEKMNDGRRPDYEGRRCRMMIARGASTVGAIPSSTSIIIQFTISSKRS